VSKNALDGMNYTIELTPPISLLFLASFEKFISPFKDYHELIFHLRIEN